MSHQKEINKFLRQINVEKLKKNHRECIELYNIVGGLYSEIGSYDEASHYHEQALELCKTIGDRLGTAVALRYIGEAKAALGNFFQAVEFIKKYLDMAQKLNNNVETQRAWTTLGRVYLMQAQELKDKNNVIDKQTKEVAREAEKRFQTALNLAESVRDQVDDKEYAQMISGLLINLGLIKDICGQYSEAVVKFNRAMETCRGAKLKDDLYRCQIILAGIYRQRNEVKLAVKISEEALQTAKSIGKKLLICDALIERGLVRICQRDFKNAKRTFAQAYLEKSPSEEDHSKAIRLTKLAHLIASAYEKICKANTPSESRLKLCDKLGDLFVAVGNYKLAVEYYRRAFSDAKVCSKPRSELARILFSVAETYADDGQFNHAMVCYEKELTYRDGNNSEQCQSLIKIAHMHEYLEHEPEVVCEAYEKALDKAGKDPKLLHNVLRYYVPYMKQKSFNPTRYRDLDDLLMNLKSYPEVVEEVEREDYEEANELEDEIANVDDIITDDEDNDEVLMIGRRKARGTSKFKSNEVGDTPLHEAAIKGDIKRVKSLVAQGHEINPRDNAGWIPLHESCNHGHYHVAEFLIEHGADVNNRGLKGMSPLHDAATNGHYDIMRLLIKNGANVISLTDTGETVLSCLRDYKSRNYSTMSNRDMSEYKQMEAELLNVMDKCGFNLMSENMKNLGVRAGTSAASTSAHTTQQRAREPQPQQLRQKVQIEPNLNPKSNTSTASSKTNPNSVKEYREAIVTMKRKRPLDVSEPNKRASQPATIKSSFSTSVSTKEWLLGDDIIEDEEEEEEEEVEFRDDIGGVKEKVRSNRPKNIIEEDDDDVLFVGEETKTNKSRSSHPKSPELDSFNLFSSPIRDPTPELAPLDDWDRDFSPPPPAPRSSRNSGRQSNDLVATRNDTRSRSPISLDSVRSVNFNSAASVQAFDLFGQPLVVSIEDRRLLIPIKDEYTTIGELKQSIVDRYSILVSAKPKIALAPKSDPNCYLFDHDLCRDVIRESLVATIESWQLKSIESSYLDNCRELELEPLDYVKIELRGVDEAGDKLDLSYLKFPRAHLKPIYQAMARRDFVCANFQGSSSWFECQKVAQDLLESTLSTWSKLTHLNLRCAGLLKSHFELLCNFKSRMPELQYIDVSVNSIAYKSKSEFSNQVKRLRRVCCGNLKRLDVRKNHLLFIKSIMCESLSAKGNNTSTKTSTSSTTNDNEHQKQETFLDISRALDMADFEILACDQYDYVIYSEV